MKLGLDIGSTTLKCVILDEDNRIIFSDYKRHKSQIIETMKSLLIDAIDSIGDIEMTVGMSGSAALGLAEALNITFIQEVYATRRAILKFLPDTNTVIELGGEDAKILFFGKHPEVRMNGTCAGGTGSFIDQMVSLLNIEEQGIDVYARNYKHIHTIASRCGVFAKTDVQALISQGVEKEDIAVSVLQSVVNQTISGLAQGRKIEGNIVYLGGPLTFIPTLRERFDATLNITGLCPQNSLYYVAIGTALLGEKKLYLSDLIKIFNQHIKMNGYGVLPPLFNNEEEFNAFKIRHDKAIIPERDPSKYSGEAFLGVDVGSTTVKITVISKDGELLFHSYNRNKGVPIITLRNNLLSFLKQYPEINIIKSCSTGYGEMLAKNAFGLEYSLVETVAHLYGARFFYPEVDFIIDIGGQDIKCFKVDNGVIDDIFLNEACSSGCGSFLQTFSEALGKSASEAAKLALKAKKPVNLGSRCTVFMNSSVKQAQKDGANLEDIFAGLAISVVKNALYKVIRCTDTSKLGKHIVVQGGTFLNDAVLRSFEKELKLKVVRPDKAQLMGAFGCALYAKEQHEKNPQKPTTVIQKEGLESFEHKVVTTQCKGCTNHCQLTINTFSEGRKFISGNKCDRIVNPSTFIKNPEELDLYNWKQKYLANLPSKKSENKIGLPLGLNFFDTLPFWNTLFTALGFETVISSTSSRDLYLKGQTTIPSDTICYPAKLMHGHIQDLYDKGVKKIFYPCGSYNINEKHGDNHFNCPVIAYYPEVLKNNIPFISSGEIELISPYLTLANKKSVIKQMKKAFPKINILKICNATAKSYKAYHEYILAIRKQSQKIIANARTKGMPIIVLAGRPYHVDEEINHGVNNLILQCGCAVISEDGVSYLVDKQKRSVLNQWTYHSRLYDSARYVTTQKDMEHVQLISFGCGLDAVTSDEVREILNNNGKISTQLKIDEIANLGAVKIRIRSLLAAVGDKNE